MARTNPSTASTHRRGRAAKSPTDMPPRGWRDVVIRVYKKIGDNALSLVAAGVGFYTFLSIFPAITALLSIYGLIADPNDVATTIGGFKGTVPPAALQIVQQQMQAIAQTSSSALGLGLVISVTLALYSASRGTGAFIAALNIVYDEHEDRSFIKLQVLTLFFTFAAILFVIVLLLVITLSGYLDQFGLPAWLEFAVRIARWVVVLGLMIVALGMAYAFAPSRRRPRFRWITPGALIATFTWLAASIGFSLYITYFGSYNKTYGSAAAIVILMLWFWISALIALVGAAINAELEGQVRPDTTVGKNRPRGERGAVVADDVRDVP